MTIERLKALAQAYGADLRRWPASERPFAESLIATDPAARAALAEAAALDALLAASPTPSPSARTSSSASATTSPTPPAASACWPTKWPTCCRTRPPRCCAAMATAR